MVFTPGLMEGHWDFWIWEMGGFIAEGKETNVMNYSLIFKTLSGRDTCYFRLHFIGQSKSSGQAQSPLREESQVLF